MLAVSVVEFLKSSNRLKPPETRVFKVESLMKQGVSSQVNVYISGIPRACELNMNPARVFLEASCLACLYIRVEKRVAWMLNKTA